MKRVISLLLAVVMLSGISVVAYADETEAKTYNYVAFGDSIASGFGLSSESGDLPSDPAIMVTEDLIADPVKAAYPAVFGELLNEIGETYGYTTKATNLAATAYRAQDVTRALQTEGFKGEIAEWIFEKSRPSSLQRRPSSAYIPTGLLPVARPSVHVGFSRTIFSMISAPASDTA